MCSRVHANILLFSFLIVWLLGSRAEALIHFYLLIFHCDLKKTYTIHVFSQFQLIGFEVALIYFPLVFPFIQK